MAMKCLNDVDPVCGMELNGYAADFTEDVEGKTYGFCSQKCKDAFHGNPKRYIENPASHIGVPGPSQIPEKK